MQEKNHKKCVKFGVWVRCGSETICDRMPVPGWSFLHQIRRCSACIAEGKGEPPYTKIANPVSELWVGDHHRFTVVANWRENVKISWYSSNKEVAGIKKTTGELTALAPGETTVTMWDSANKKKQKITLTVKAVPVLPEIPREWYTVEEKPDWISEDGIQLVLKSEYRYLYEQCSMLRIPESIDGKNVIWLCMDDALEATVCSLDSFGFTQLKMVQCPGGIVPFVEANADEVIYSDRIRWIDHDFHLDYKRIHVPESVELLICNGLRSEEMGEVRIPAGVKFLCHNVRDSYYYGIVHGENVRFAVDGNNTHYYSILDVLFACPYQEESPLEQGILLADYEYACYVNVEKHMLLAYPKNKAGEVYYVPDGIERIEDGAFSGAQYLKKIILPDSVTEIGELAFDNIRNKVEIVIPSSVTEFEESGEGGPFGLFGFDDTAKDRFTIITPKGSAAEAYAMEKGIPYQSE